MNWPNMFARVFVCLYACFVRLCMYACVHVCMYTFMHVCLYACVHVHTCIFKVWSGNGQVCIEVFKGANPSKGSFELVTHIYQHAYRLGAWLSRKDGRKKWWLVDWITPSPWLASRHSDTGCMLESTTCWLLHLSQRDGSVASCILAWHICLTTTHAHESGEVRVSTVDVVLQVNLSTVTLFNLHRSCVWESMKIHFVSIFNTCRIVEVKPDLMVRQNCWIVVQVMTH